MAALGRCETQCARDGLEDLERCADVATLLKPGVPGDPYTRELRDLFPPQAWGAPATAAWETDLFGCQALAPGAQEIRQLVAAALSIALFIRAVLGAVLAGAGCFFY